MSKMTDEIAKAQKEFAVAAAEGAKAIAELKTEYARVTTGLPQVSAKMEKLSIKIADNHRSLKTLVDGTQAFVEWLPYVSKQWEELLPLARDAEKTLDQMDRESKEKKAHFKAKSADRKVQLESQLWEKAYQKAQRDAAFYKLTFDNLDESCRDPLKTLGTLEAFKTEAANLGRHLAKLEVIVKDAEASLRYEARGHIKQPVRYQVKRAT